MTDPRQRPDQRQQPSAGRNEDPNLGQKEAEKEKAELEEEEDENDEFEPMERLDDQRQRRSLHR
jgi:hypothetical protein